MPKTSMKKSRFSNTVRSWYSPKRWGMYPMTFFTSVLSFTTSSPATSMAPEVGGIMVAIMRKRVVLPAPSDPTSPIICPSSTLNDVSERAVVFP